MMRKAFRAIGKVFERGWNWLFGPPYCGVPWLVWLYVIGAMFCYPHGGVFTGYITGYDDPVRMTQVLDWVNGHSWYDHRIMRVDPPDGFQTIWSRIVDVPIAFVIVIAQQFVTQKKAAMIASIVVPMVELRLLFAAAAYFIRPLAGKKNARLISLFLVFSTICNYRNFSVSGFYPGEASHHPWYIILGTLFFGAVARVGVGIAGRGAVAMMAMTIGVALAVGIESFPLFAGAAMLLAFECWYFRRPTIGIRAAEGFSGGALLGLLLLPAYQPPAHLISISFVEPSLLGPILLAAAALFLWMAAQFTGQWSRGRSLIGIIVAAALIGVALFAAFPMMRYGAAAGLSPAERLMAYKEHLEAQPLFKVTHETADLVSLFLPLGLALIGAVWALDGVKSKRRQALLLSYTGLTLLGSGMACIFARYYHQAITVACGWLLWLWQRLNGYLRKGSAYYSLASLAIFVVLGPFTMHLLPAFARNAPTLSQVVLFPAKLQSVKEPCGLMDFANYINTHYSKDTDLLVPGIDSSRLLYTTDVEIDFLNNYPSQDRFIDNETFFGTQLPSVAEEIIARHHVDLVAVCKVAMMLPPLKPGEAPMMFELLEAGLPPPWLKPVPIEVDGLYHLYEVDKAAVAGTVTGDDHEP